MTTRRLLLPICWLLVLMYGTHSFAGEPSPAAKRGYHTLRHKPFLPADFDDDVFAELWKRWPEPLRSNAEKATPTERRRMTFVRYGLIEPPDGKGTGPALGYVSDGKGRWIMNCLTCHGGKVAGKTIPGLPNTLLDLQSLTEDVRETKRILGNKPYSHMDLGSLKIPLNSTAGTTNSVIFGVALGSLRDKHMNVSLTLRRPKYVHHDLDAPPWWHVKRKKTLYCDGFAPKNHRVLMQFILVPKNGRKTVQAWESDFADLLAWIEMIEPPKYPWPIDKPLAARGKTVFEKNCSRCHGTYGPGGKYPEKVIPLRTVGTDPVRLRALNREHREWMKESWMSRYGKDPVNLDPGGYLAPPLDGIWATAPYFHNGSVPTLWHVLHPDKRPAIWKRKSTDGYDRKQLGLEIETFDAVPKSITDKVERRRFFDTSKPGKSAAGHRFPEALTEDEKRAVLEYLKTL